MTSAVLINCFEVDPAQDDRFLALWRRAEELLAAGAAAAAPGRTRRCVRGRRAMVTDRARGRQAAWRMPEP